MDVICPGLGRRISTYHNLARAHREFQPAFDEYRQLLANRSPSLLKAVMACADVAFFVRSMPEDEAERLQAMLPGVTSESIECWIEIASRIIAEAHELRPISAIEREAEVSSGLVDPSLQRVFEIAAIRCALGEHQKSVRILGYDVVREPGPPTAYVLTPTSPDFERLLVVSHAAGQLALHAEELRITQHNPDAASRTNAAAVFATHLRAQWATVVESPFPRVLVRLPLANELPRLRLDGTFIEDVVEQAVLVEGLELDGVDCDSADLLPGLTIAQFLRLFQRLRTQVALHSELVRQGANGSPQLVFNSLLPVVSREGLLGLLADPAAGVTVEATAVFIDALTWRPRSATTEPTSHLDLQYTPLIPFGERFLLSPRLALHANALRNAFAALRVRVRDAGGAFERRVGTLLRAAFPHVAIARSYSAPGGKGDVDVAVLHEDTLYVFECKHSLPAATIHEHRDLLDDIERATGQLIRTRRILESDPGLRTRLRQWFPNAAIGGLEGLRIVPCVVTATRMFSGIELSGVPIRDVFSLEQVLRHGTISSIRTLDETVTVQSYSFWRGPAFSAEDLADYLRGDGIYWRTRVANAQEMRIVDAEAEGIQFVSATWRVVFDPSNDNDAVLLALGLRRTVTHREPLVHLPRSSAPRAAQP